MWMKARYVMISVLTGLSWSTQAFAQQRITCPDKTQRIAIDLKQIQIQYNASSFAGTLASLGALSAHLSVEQKVLQQVSATTQQWNEFLKGLVAGYNSCVITDQQYADSLKRIYPRLKEDAAGLEEIRKVVSEGRKADEKRLKTLLDSYFANLRQFARVSGNEIIIERITAVIEKNTADVLKKQDTTLDVLATLQKQLEAIERNQKEAPLATPAQITKEVSAIKEKLLAKADEAQAAYEKGYDLYQRYRFAEAIPHLKEALMIIPLSDFYLALGNAFWALPDLAEAEKTYTEGLRQSIDRKDRGNEAVFSNQLGRAFQAKGDLAAALRYTQRALAIDEKLYGPNHPDVAIRANNIGMILKDKGDLDGALRYTQRALTIGEKVYGPNHPDAAIRANNIGMILKDKGDLDAALRYTQRALTIDEKLYGPNHPNVAIRANNIGQILQDKGDLDAALGYSRRALNIDEKVYGPDHPNAARNANNIGLILQDKGDLNAALGYSRRALNIDEKVYGPDHPNAARNANNIGLILQDKGDLNGALSYVQRALTIDEKVYGPDHPSVATLANNIGQILKAEGDLDAALRYIQRALTIDEKVYGPDHPDVARDANNIGMILKAKGDLDGALRYTERAFKIVENNYGAENPLTKIVAGNLRHIKNQLAEQSSTKK
jgi:tetratricopeptide (TPR) repeat protein